MVLISGGIIVSMGSSFQSGKHITNQTFHRPRQGGGGVVLCSFLGALQIDTYIADYIAQNVAASCLTVGQH